VRVAIAGTRTAARLLVHHRAGLTIVSASARYAETSPQPCEGGEPEAIREALAPLPIESLTVVDSAADIRTLRRWGITTLGELAALDGGEVSARLGQAGAAWQRLARGEDPRPLLPAVPEERFEQALDLEWPIEGLEPLSFVLGRLMDPLSAHLERRDRGAAVLHVRLQLVSKAADGSREVHERSLQLPTPIRDARTLRTLALLDLESHPPTAAIDRVAVAVDPTPGRVVQFSLLTRPLPPPEQVSTLIARLDALMGQGRSGSPVPVDSWQPGAFAMGRFAPADQIVGQVGRVGRVGKDATPPASSPHPASSPYDAPSPQMALRRFRIPVPARVRVERGAPVRVVSDRQGLGGGTVETCAGPWRTSGGWWSGDGAGRAGEAGKAGGASGAGGVSGGSGWDRDEWDVTLRDGATYRVFREREADAWFIEGIVD
jgi:hypothetical protein